MKNKIIKYTLISLIFFKVLLFFSCQNAEIPEIINSYPNNSVPYTEIQPQIFIEFNKKMNKKSVESSFSFTSKYSGTDGTFRWQENKMFYDLTDQLEYGGRYTMSMSSEAEDAKGNTISKDYIVHFYVGENRTLPKVLNVSPTDLSINVLPDSPIILIFNQEMKTKETEEAFSLSPSADGYFSWANSNQELTFTPYDDLTFGQNYTISLSTSAETINGAKPLEKFSSFFRVGENFDPIIILSQESSNATVLTDGVTGIEKNEGFVFTFNKAMDVDSVESNFSIKKLEDLSSVTGIFYWNVAYDQFRFQPEDNLDLETTYRLELKKSAKDIYGNQLDDDTYLDFTVDGLNSQYLDVSSILLENCGGTVTITPNPGTLNEFDLTDSSRYYTVDIAGGVTLPSSCDFIINFSVPVKEETIFENVTIERIVGSGSTSTGAFGCDGATCYSMNALKDQAKLFLEDLGDTFNEAQYRITITGGINGILDQNNNYLQEDLVLIIHPKGT